MEIYVIRNLDKKYPESRQFIILYLFFFFRDLRITKLISEYSFIVRINSRSKNHNLRGPQCKKYQEKNQIWLVKICIIYYLHFIEKRINIKKLIYQSIKNDFIFS